MHPALACLVRPSPDQMARLRYLHQRLSRLAEKFIESLSDAEVVRAIENEIVHVLVRCLDENSPVTASHAGLKPRQNHSPLLRIFWRRMFFSRCISQKYARPPELPKAACAPAARSIWAWAPSGISGYAACIWCGRALLLATPEVSTVTQIAMDHGFWELVDFNAVSFVLRRTGFRRHCTGRRRKISLPPQICGICYIARHRKRCLVGANKGAGSRAIDAIGPPPIPFVFDMQDILLRPPARERFMASSEQDAAFARGPASRRDGPDSRRHVPHGLGRHYPEEAPVHRVTVDGFWIDRTPVTNRQFRNSSRRPAT